MFTSLLEQATTSTGAEGLSFVSAVLCLASALLFGFIIALIYMLGGRYSKSFAVSLVLLPAVVQVVIMMVNGNLGMSVAVLGTFSLVRFRSAPGSSKEICSIFFAMAVGLATGMGYITFAALITVVLGGVLLILTKTNFGEPRRTEHDLKITIPENLDYTGVFDNILEKYTTGYSLEKIKTTNLGSMFELHYSIKMKNNAEEKKLIDELRCCNGNLPIVYGRVKTASEEL